jgi:predicted phage tail protein
MTGLVDGWTYTFTVAAINAFGTGPESAPSVPITLATVPGSPTIANVTTRNQGATVSWTAPTSDGGTPVTGYLVTPYTDGVAPAPVRFNSTATTQTITGLTNGVTYTFTVAATNAVGTGPESAPSNPVTPGPTMPDPPTILRNATAANQSATISWLPPASDGGSPITGYVVTAYVGYGPVKVRIFNSPLTTRTVTGLTNGTEYRFRVRAYNAYDISGYSTVTNPVTPTA